MPILQATKQVTYLPTELFHFGSQGPNLLPPYLTFPSLIPAAMFSPWLGWTPPTQVQAIPDRRASRWMQAEPHSWSGDCISLLQSRQIPYTYTSSPPSVNLKTSPNLSLSPCLSSHSSRKPPAQSKFKPASRSLAPTWVETICWTRGHSSCQNSGETDQKTKRENINPPNKDKLRN